MIYSYPSLFQSLQPMTCQTFVETCSLPIGSCPDARALSLCRCSQAGGWREPSWSHLPPEVSLPLEVSPWVMAASGAPTGGGRSEDAGASGGHRLGEDAAEGRGQPKGRDRRVMALASSDGNLDLAPGLGSVIPLGLSLLKGSRFPAPRGVQAPAAHTCAWVLR